MKTAASLGLAVLAATTANAFIIPSTVSAPELSVTSDNRIINDAQDFGLSESITPEGVKVTLEDILKHAEEAFAFTATMPRPDVFEEQSSPHLEGPPPPPAPVNCDNESNPLSLALCRARNAVSSAFSSFSAPGPRRHGCHRGPRPDRSSPPSTTEEAGVPLPAALIPPPPPPPPGFPRPHGGPLKFWPRPDGPGDREDFRPPPGAGGEVTDEQERDWDAYHGRPHHHHHHGPTSLVSAVLHTLVSYLLVPLVCGFLGAVAASLLGMLVGPLVGRVWIKFVRGGKRGSASLSVGDEGDADVSEKAVLLVAQKDGEAAEEFVEPPPEYVLAPVYVEKA